MPDRNLREFNRAGASEFDRLKAQVSELTMRSWRGAMRTAGPVTPIPPTSGIPTPLVSVDAPPGRWEVHVSATVTGPTDVGDMWKLSSMITPIDDGDMLDPEPALPVAEAWIHWTSTAENPTRLPLVAFGWIAPPRRFTLTALAEAPIALVQPTWTDVRIMLLPW